MAITYVLGTCDSQMILRPLMFFCNMLMRPPHTLQELRGIGLAGYEAPEWKTKAMGKAPTFGYSDVRPIKEQRESLPVFKLRDQLIQAVNEHQVLSRAT